MPGPQSSLAGAFLRLVRRRVPYLLLAAGALALTAHVGWLAIPPGPLLALLAAATVASLLGRLWSDGHPSTARLHVRIAIQALAVTVVVYATGWGPTLAFAYLYAATENIALEGSRAVRPSIAWTVLWLAAGQVAVAAGLFPVLLPVPHVHGVALLAGLGVAVAIRLVGAAARRAERAQAEVHRSEQQYRGLFEGHPLPMWVFDAETLQLLAVNDAALAQYGYAREAILGTPLHALWPPEAVERVHRSPVPEPGRPVGCFRLPRRDGAPVEAEVTVHEVTFAGRPARLVAALDVTERVRAEAQLRTLSQAVEQSPTVVVITDRDDRIEYVNPRFTEVTGYRPDEVRGRDASRLWVLPPSALEAIRRTLAAGGTWRGEVLARRRSGEPYWERVTAAPIRDAAGGVTGFVRVAEDVTERRRAEEELQRLYAELEARVAERTRQLEAANRALQAREQELDESKRVAERASLAKSEFLSRMSHELRTPLNAMLGFAQLLRREPLAPEQQEAVDHILQAGRHLLDLITEILDITRIEAGRLAISREPVPVAEVVQECIDLIAPAARERQVRLAVDAPADRTLHVLGDRQRLRQVLLNLLSNGVKYNRPAGDLTLAWSPVAVDRLRIEVRDTGRGIPRERQADLFKAFERLGVDEQHVEGLGLGLALSRGLVELMHGRIGVESEVGRGSTFWVELPLVPAPVERLGRRPPRAEPRVAPEVTEWRRAVTLLYIEDNLSNLELVQRLLAPQRRVRLLTAETGELGVELARQYLPDLVLLDLHLPDLPGGEVLRRLREHPETAGIPVVVISADATRQRAEELLAAGARAYLTKPVDLDRLLRVIAEVCTPSWAPSAT